jgi:hypothetical protein
MKVIVCNTDHRERTAQRLVSNLRTSRHDKRKDMPLYKRETLDDVGNPANIGH